MSQALVSYVPHTRIQQCSQATRAILFLSRRDAAPRIKVMSKTTIDTGAEGVRDNGTEPPVYRFQPSDTADDASTTCADGNTDVADVVRKLKAKLQDYHHKRARRAGWSRRFVPTGLAPLDAVLPYGGLPCGAITEIFSGAPGAGSTALAMRIASRCTTCEPHLDVAGASSDRRHIVLIDTTSDFYPPAAWQYGIALDRLIVIRPTNEKEAFWATEQVLRCSGVAAVIASPAQLEEHLSRRLQLAAENSGCIGLLLRSTSRRTKSFAAIQMLVESVGAEESNTSIQTVYPASIPLAADDVRPCRITLLKVREGMPTEPLLVDLHHETGTWPLHPVPVDRPATKLA